MDEQVSTKLWSNLNIFYKTEKYQELAGLLSRVK